MALLTLNQSWSEAFEKYRSDHQDPRNQAMHKIGIPLILASIPVGMTVVGLPLAAALFTTGWTFQFIGHAFEGKKPSFVDDKRSFVIGALWCFEKYGMKLVEQQPV